MTEANNVFVVISHDKEKQSDFIRGIYKSEESASKKVEQIKKEYSEISGLDDFDTYYSVRIEMMKVEE